MTQGRRFYHFSGEVTRAQFLVNSLIIGAISGVSFSLLVFAGGRAPQPITSAAAYSLPQLWLYGTLLGIICGPILVLVSGLTCFWLGLFYALIFVTGPLVASPGTFALAGRNIFLFIGLVMVCTVALAYINVARRMRSVLPASRRIHLWSMIIFLLSIVPIVGTISYWTLLIVPTRSSPGSEGVVRGSDGTDNG